jgi:tetratricopeptide (TPR) repeat protein
MQIKPEQRAVPVVSTSDWSGRIMLPAIACVIVMALLAFTFQDLTSRWFYAVEEAVGLAPSQQPFAATYRRLGISTVPLRLFAQDRISKSLTRLSQEACDRQAIYSLANALAAGGEQRQAASALMNFSLSCPGSENEQAAAGQLFLTLGDAEQALAVANALISAKPEIANYHYFRAKALVAAGHGVEAVNEYKSTIDLNPSPNKVGEWVFLELADLYATLDRPCDAAKTIVDWVAIDPTVRNTARAHKLAETYAARGCILAPKPAPKSL